MAHGNADVRVGRGWGFLEAIGDGFYKVSFDRLVTLCLECLDSNSRGARG